MDFSQQRKQMVQKQLKDRGIKDPRVLAAFLKIPRHLFVSESELDLAYYDGPLPIGENQTISQPYVVAYMTEALGVKPTDKILEIGTGSGYQAAILSQLAGEVYTVEIIESLKKRATQTLKDLELLNVHTNFTDGTFGLKKEAPFDAIIVTAEPNKLPLELIKQLKVGGKLIIPIERSLRIYKKTGEDKYQMEDLLPVLFVPMTGAILD